MYKISWRNSAQDRSWLGSLKLPRFGVLRVGRARDADLRLNDPRVSRSHAFIICEGDRIEISDAGSSNGTALGNAKVSRSAWTVSEDVSIGPFELRLSRPEGLEAPPRYERGEPALSGNSSRIWGPAFKGTPSKGLLIASLVLGLLGGMTGLLVGLFAFVFAGVVGAVSGGPASLVLAQLLAIASPTATIVGAAMVMTKPPAGAVLMGLGALLFLFFGLNSFTAIPILLSALGSGIALFALVDGEVA